MARINGMPPAVSQVVDGAFQTIRNRVSAGRQNLELIRLAGARRAVVALVLHLAVGALPIVFLVSIGLALQAVAQGDRVPEALVVALLAFTAQQLLTPLQPAVSTDVALAVDGACTDRLMRRALGEAPLRSLESPEVADELAKATEGLDLLTLTPGQAAEAALALVARYTQLVGACAVLVVTVGPLPAALALAVALIGRWGQTTAFRRWGRVVGGLGPARRRILYLRDLGGGTGAAKELRTLDLVDWLDDVSRARTRDLLGDLWARRRGIYGRPFVLYSGLAAVGAITALVFVALRGGRSGDLAGITMAVQAVVLCARFGVIFPESDVKLVYGRQAWLALAEVERLTSAGTGPGAQGPTAAAAPATTPQTLLRDRLTVRGVTFGYTPDRPVLAGLDLTIPAGRSLAVVGINGAGKTTLVKLLTGLYTPQGGTVAADGVDLRAIDPVAWQRRCAVLFQDFVRYDLSLGDNVAAGAIEHLDDEAGIREALRQAGLGGLPEALPRGLATTLGRADGGGADLSGGQWQRVALARALFAVRHGADLLILDEPTAQLDARGEAEFYASFLDLTRGSTTSLVISHRFSTVRLADRIVVLDGGTVREQGTHDELVAAGGYYARAFAVQADRYSSGGGAR